MAQSIDATHSSAEPLEMYVASITLVPGKVSLQGRLKDFFLIYFNLLSSSGWAEVLEGD